MTPAALAAAWSHYEMLEKRMDKTTPSPKRPTCLPLLRPAGERVAIPYEGRQLFGNLRKPLGNANAPIAVMCMGLDSAKEEMDDYENRFLRRPSPASSSARRSSSIFLRRFEEPPRSRAFFAIS